MVSHDKDMHNMNPALYPILFRRAHTPMSILNLFRFGNAISALIWASALAVLVLLVMLLVQRILSLKEIVEVD